MISTITDERIKPFTGLNERQLRTLHEPESGCFICESERVIRRALAAGYEIDAILAEDSNEAVVSEWMVSQPGAQGYVASYEVLRGITGYSLTGGLLALMRRKKLPEARTLAEAAAKVVILDDVENPTNTGAIFRCCAALGAEAVLLTDGCADPLSRRASRVSMGTVFAVPWAYMGADEIDVLKDMGYHITVMELTEDAVCLRQSRAKAAPKRAVVMGNENAGVRKRLLNVCDEKVMIPMQHEVDSLNVAAAAAIALWELFG